jgi:hypothetical protein
MTIENTDKILSLGGKETDQKESDDTVPPRNGSLQTERVDSKSKD